MVAVVDEGLVANIAGDNPVGRDLTYEPSFQELQAEMEQASSPSGRPVAWPKVSDLAGRLLREESKDLRLASWWFVAMTHLEGWDGFLRALGVYRAVADQHWEAMYPSARRARARAGLVEWMWEGTKKALAVREVAAENSANLQAALTALGELDALLAGRLGELNPGVGPLRSLLREKSERVATPPAPPPPPPPVPAASLSAPVASAGPVTAPPSPTASMHVAPPPRTELPDVPQDAALETILGVASSLRERLLSVASAARVEDATEPFAYRTARVAAWLSIDAPPDVERGKTFVRAPRSTDVAELRALFDGGQWPELVVSAEASLGDHPYWLDLNFFTYSGLDRLGPAFARARSVVLHETRSFVDRVPGVESMLFQNGTSFASPDTLSWLRAQRGSRTTVATGDADEAVEGLVATARGGCAEGRVGDALAEGLASAGLLASTRSRFRARLALAALAIAEGRKELGVTLLEDLVEEIDVSVERWEPGLAAEAISALLQATSFRANDASDARQRLLFRRLLTLDPVSALRIGS